MSKAPSLQATEIIFAHVGNGLKPVAETLISMAFGVAKENHV
jgi:hypothetical protein